MLFNRYQYLHMDKAMHTGSPMTIIDAVMGTGKSTWAINKINGALQRKFIILTPYLDEVKRYKEAISADHSGTRKDVVALDDDASESKTKRFIKALQEGKTIIATHELFSLLDDECFRLIEQGDYDLMLDETMTMVTEDLITEADVTLLIKDKLLDVRPTEKEGMVTLERADKAIEYRGAHEAFLKAAESGHVYRVNSSTIVFVVPPNRMTAFKQVHIMTYLFDDSETHGWLQLFSLDHQHKKLLQDGSGHKIEAHDLKYSGSDFRGKIAIFDGKKLNTIGEKKPKGRKHPLTHTWYKLKRKGYKKGDKGPLDTLRKNVVNYFKNKMKAKSGNILWTCPKAHREILSDRYFDPARTETWLASNTRATNEFNDRHVLAFLLDVFRKPSITNFFKKHGIRIDADRFALSTLLQWMWRSAIRKDEPIAIYLPSRRMRELLEGWLY